MKWIESYFLIWRGKEYTWSLSGIYYLLTDFITYGADNEPYLRSHELCRYSRTSQHFMEPECSLSCSQEHSIGPCPKPDRSTPYHPILRSILLLSTHLCIGLPSALLPYGFPTNILYAFLFSPFRATWHVHLILPEKSFCFWHMLLV
jgi:hypothetical protein